ncbi:MAG: DUF4747 family protein [Bacteroidetes bacterium]|nr:DUF4747 family protein [Bacteroidota bacterium]
MEKIFYSRYHISTGKDLTDKLDFILTGLRNDASVSDRGFLYKFFNSEIVEFNKTEYVTGELVKYNPDDDEEVVDDETMTIKTENIHNKVIGKVRYIIDPTSSIIMHFERPNIISTYSFRKKFALLFEQNHDNFFTEFSISPIKEQYSFIEKIKTYKAVKRISITLFPSNPNYSDRWKSIDERMRDIGIDKYREIQEANKPNANIKIDDETENKFLMSEDGYGECDAFGITENGDEKRISTRDRLKNIHSTIPDEIANRALDILQNVSETLNEIIKRTSK